MSIDEGRVSEQDRAAFQRDGAIALRGALDLEWIDRMRNAIARLESRDPAITTWMARRDPDFRALAEDSGLPELAGRMMGVTEVRFFYDQLFTRNPQSELPTPLHQDLPYWPVDGEQIISVWVPFDTVSTDNGVVEYIGGSHRWGRLFEPAPFAKGETRRASELGSAGLEILEDPQSLIERSTVLSWELEPGDVLVHDARTLHFATPNRSANSQRRAIALRYIGPDAQFIDRPGNFTRRKEPPAHWPSRDEGGILLAAENFPVIWRAPGA